MSVDEARALEEEWARIVRERDGEAATTFLSDDFVLSSEGGVAANMPRAQWLEALNAIDTNRLEPSNIEARAAGEVLVVRASLDWDARMGDRDLTGEYSVVDVFTRVDGRWRAWWRLSERREP